jgi:serine/threonine protein phosphatase PrpC
MEDEYYISPGGRFTAVFDGHGGGGVSTWLRTKLYGLVCHYLKETHWEEQTEETAGRTPSLSAHVAALRKAFGQVEKDILAQETLAYQGSTAVVVAMHESDDGHRTLVAANVGDSRAILSRRGKAIDLTRDHKPNEEREKARILNMGEVIEWDSLSKVHRVRNLSLSRAIGDRYAKPVVSSQVEVKLFPITEEGDEFFLLASDGLWDVMTSQEVVSYVHSRFEKELKREQLQTQEDKENYKLVLRRNMARSVAREALRRGTGDNICVVMVWMKDLQNSKAP